MVWADGEWLPSEPEILARLVRCKPSAVPIILKDLAFLGWFSSGGRLQNAKVALVRREAAQVMVSRRNVCRGAAQQRWAKPEHASRMHDACVTHTSGIPPASVTHASAMHELSTVQYRTVHNTVNTAERLTLNGLPREKAAESPERDFLTAVGEMMEAWKKGAGTSEMKNWGGWWRNKFRKSPKKARAVLNDVRSLVNERRITKNPGNAAVDLWKRLP
jgi:hypothetical protein